MTKNKTLPEGIYDVPAHCRAVIRDGQVAIIARPPKTAPRCTTCTHCIYGYSSRYQRYPHRICELRPKQNTERDKHTDPPRFYAVQPYDVACDRYKPSNPETK